jgi:hypothetical protein
MIRRMLGSETASSVNYSARDWSVIRRSQEEFSISGFLVSDTPRTTAGLRRDRQTGDATTRGLYEAPVRGVRVHE